MNKSGKNKDAHDSMQNISRVGAAVGTHLKNSVIDLFEYFALGIEIELVCMLSGFTKWHNYERLSLTFVKSLC